MTHTPDKILCLTSQTSNAKLSVPPIGEKHGSKAKPRPEVYTHQCLVCREPAFSFHHDIHTNGNEYVWYCENCGTSVAITFTNDGVDCVQHVTGLRMDRTVAILRFSEAPHIMVIHEGCIAHDNEEGNTYYYEEHTCPTNILGCAEIAVCGDLDPHGCLELVKEYIVTGPRALYTKEEALELAQDEIIKLTQAVYDAATSTAMLDGGTPIAESMAADKVCAAVNQALRMDHPKNDDPITFSTRIYPGRQHPNLDISVDPKILREFNKSLGDPDRDVHFPVGKEAD